MHPSQTNPEDQTRMSSLGIGIGKNEHLLRYLNLGGSQESVLQLCKLLETLYGICIASVKEHVQCIPFKDANKSITQIARRLHIVELIVSGYMGKLELKADGVL